MRAPLLPSARSIDDDRRLRDLRKDNKITAILHTGYPIRHWDKDLGPGAPHLLALNLGGDATPIDVTPRPSGALRDADFDVSDDGSFVVTSWQRPAPGASLHSVLVRIDVASGEHTVIADEPGADLWSPAISPDGVGGGVHPRVVLHAGARTANQPGLLEVRRGAIRVSRADWDRWPASVTWSHDGDALLVTADDGGRCPVFRIRIGDGEVEPLTTDDYAYTDVTTAPGGVVYALRSSYASPPHPVRIDPRRHRHAAAVRRARPRCPAHSPRCVATHRRRDRGAVVAGAAGARKRPAPLLLWVHGGPLASWNSWHWRWNPWVLAARGYAVLLPDPALSTGYGQDFIQRGWGNWGGAPFDDLMAATDAACAIRASMPRAPP